MDWTPPPGYEYRCGQCRGELESWEDQELKLTGLACPRCDADVVVAFPVLKLVA